MILLENDQLSVTIRPQGAELTSLRYVPDGTEHLWQADPAVWGWHAPNLFPVVGGCLNNVLRINGQEFPMARHGFARQSAFLVASTTPTTATFVLRNTPATHPQFPYKFRFEIAYALNGATLSITYHVANEDEQPVFFSVGAHPAFNVPFSADDTYQDYYVQFDVAEPLATHRLSANGLFTGETEPVALEEGNRLRLTPSLFDQDALVFKNLRSRAVSLRSDKHKRSVTVRYPDFPYLGLWAKPGASFVCIEPWLGCADTEGKATDISQKEAIQRVDVGGTFSATFFIEIGSRQ